MSLKLKVPQDKVPKAQIPRHSAQLAIAWVTSLQVDIFQVPKVQ